MRLAMLVCLGLAVVTMVACAEANRPACAEGSEQVREVRTLHGAQ